MCLLEDQLSIFSDALADDLNHDENTFKNLNEDNFSSKQCIQFSPLKMNKESIIDLEVDEKDQDRAQLEKKVEEKLVCCKCKHEVSHSDEAHHEDSQALDNTAATQAASADNSPSNDHSMTPSEEAEDAEDSDDQTSLPESKCDKANKFVRWRRDNDKTLFCCLQTLEDHGVISLQFILDLTDITASYFSNNVRLLADLSSWKGTLFQLVKRIQFLCSIEEFTARELKLFKRLLKQQIKADELELRKILYEFPGKSIEYIEKMARDIYKISNRVKTLKAKDFKNAKRSKK